MSRLISKRHVPSCRRNEEEFCRLNSRGGSEAMKLWLPTPIVGWLCPNHHIRQMPSSKTPLAVRKLVSDSEIFNIFAYLKMNLWWKKLRTKAFCNILLVLETFEWFCWKSFSSKSSAPWSFLFDFSQFDSLLSFRGSCKKSKERESRSALTWKISSTFLGHLNGVNVIGISLQQPVPTISGQASLKPPPIINQPTSGDFSSLQMQLQPRRPTTGNVDFLLPLQPELLLGNLWLPVI